MDFRRLQYFICLYEEANITRAAAKLNLVQPALSMQIRRLEQELDLQLFERTGRGVVPTPAAKALFDLYRPILLDLRAANQRAKQLGGKVLGKIAVGIIPSLTNSVVADVLSQFDERYPEVDVRIDEAYSGTLVEWVRHGDLDFAVVNQTHRQSGIASQTLLTEELLLVHRRGEGKQRPRSVRFSQLAKMDLVLPSPRHGLRLIVQQIAEEQGLAIAPHFEVDALAPTLKLVAETDLMTVLPAVVARKAAAEGPLWATKIVDPQPARELIYVHRSQWSLTLAATKFLELMTNELTRAIQTKNKATQRSAGGRQANHGGQNDGD